MDTRYAVVNPQGDITNVIIADDSDSDWTAPDGHTTAASDEYDIGGTLIDGEYVPPPPPEQDE